MTGVIAFLGIGSNLGDPGNNCRDALRRLQDLSGVSLVRVSSLYRTEPVGTVEQPWFVNAVAEVRTRLEPADLLRGLQGIEQDMGRRDKGTGGSRIIDLDILLYGSALIDGEDLVIPHNELHRRRFVLVPLNEIAPWAIHPRFGISAQGLLNRLDDRSVVEKIDDFP